MLKNISSMLIMLLTLSACSIQPDQQVQQRYEDWAKETEAIKVFSVQKQITLDEIGPFDLDRRFYFYETMDELANKLWRSPKNTIIRKVKIEEQGEIGILELSDRDLDGQPDMFAFPPTEGGTTEDFGFLFDLNKDERVDYLVFNGGPMFTKDMEFYWMNYHWIDSNYDGQIDILVNNAVTLGASELPEKGLTAWIYDTNFDGYIDKAEYNSAGVTRVVEKKNGALTVNWFLEDIDVADVQWQEFSNVILFHINTAIE